MIDETKNTIQRTPEGFAAWLRAAGASEALIAATPLQPPDEGHTAELERARYAVKTIIDERVLGRGVFHQISHQHYAEVLLQAVDDYLEALAALEAK